eukprot:780375-Prorocentrum_lima.AAC.1
MTQLWKKGEFVVNAQGIQEEGLQKCTRMDCWHMLWEFSGHQCQCHMKTLKENKVDNPAGLWDGTS